MKRRSFLKFLGFSVVTPKCLLTIFNKKPKPTELIRYDDEIILYQKRRKLSGNGVCGDDILCGNEETLMF